MAFEELLQLLSKSEAVDAKQEEVMRLFMLATAESVAAGELTPGGDLEWKAIAARGEALGLQLLARAAASVETSTRMAAEFAARPGGEAVAEAHRRMAASATALGARAHEYAAFMRDVGKLADSSDSDSDSESDSAKRPAVSRCRRPNARYFGPEWRSN